MMGFILIAAAVLSLLSGGWSAPVTNCDNLTQIIEIQGREQLLGKWTYSADSSHEAGSQSLTKLSLGTTWVKYTAAEENDTINVLQSQKMFGTCLGLRYSMTLENNTLSVEDPLTASMVLLSTGCPDCLVIASENTFGRSAYDSLMLLTRRNNVTAAEMEEFNKQAECLNLPSPVFLDSKKGFCTEESLYQKTENLTSIASDSFQAD
ncbi:hypothetical protein D5F01_LYC00214 [Larimichthys crocea]|uniref:Apolipoprotein M n=1 Tax=Larimichthys crocea TaxID=215358 RepID=A0A6G0J8H0_LARCR|nr:hypothetical protein D5F01_LYC00214 [Larimichthys crocea]